jgi:HAD superfamily hydrolase (TIGR01509 family)
VPLDVDAICFDLDDTLCVYERTVENMLALSFDRAGIEPFFDGVTYRTYFDRFLEEFDDGDALRAHCFAEIARDQGRDPAVGREVAAEYAAARDPANVRPRPGALDVVRELSGAYPLALVTNGDATMQAGKLDSIGLRDAFDEVVFAGEDTAPKPDAEPFEHVLSTLDVAADRTVHVGNSLDSDVAGARAAGLRTVWTPAAHDLPEDVDEPAAIDGASPAVDPAPDHVLGGVAELGTLLDAAE